MIFGWFPWLLVFCGHWIDGRTLSRVIVGMRVSTSDAARSFDMANSSPAELWNMQPEIKLRTRSTPFQTRTSWADWSTCARCVIPNAWPTDCFSSFLTSQDREAEPRFSSGGQGGMRGGFGGPMRGGFGGGGGGYDAMGGGMAGGSRQIYVSNVRLSCSALFR